MIYMIGIDHTLAPIDVRSAYAYTKNECAEVMKKILLTGCADGVVCIATCNRTEVWIDCESGRSREEIREAAFSCMGKGGRIPSEDGLEYFSERTDEEAIFHLFQLTAGLKSAILAEDQILTQVNDALAFAREQRCTDKVLEILFRMAVTAAKKVKTEVKFERADATAVDQALAMLIRKGYDPRRSRCMVIGNGAYGKLAAARMIEAGAEVTVTVRQYHKGVVEIPMGCKLIPYTDRLDIFPDMDLIISATASPHYTLEKEAVEAVLASRKEKLGTDDADRTDFSRQGKVILDLAVPRDVEPAVSEIEGISVYTIDDFRTEESELNREAMQKADAILQENMEEFRTKMKERTLVAGVESIRHAAENDFGLRVRKEIRKLPLTEEEKAVLLDHMEKACGRTVAKLFYDLQDRVSPSCYEACIFGLEDDHGKESD